MKTGRDFSPRVCDEEESDEDDRRVDAEESGTTVMIQELCFILAADICFILMYALKR